MQRRHDAAFAQLPENAGPVTMRVASGRYTQSLTAYRSWPQSVSRTHIIGVWQEGDEHAH
jgi:hypothetical protein